MSKHSEFLKFRGHDILYVSKEGKIYVAINPICEALEVHTDRSRRNLKEDTFFGPEQSIQTVQVSKNGKKQGRAMVCLPEHLIYGWIMTLNSKSPELADYKKTCCKVLSDYFHGEIGDRKNVITAMLKEEAELKTLKNEIGAMPILIAIRKKEKLVKAYRKELKNMDLEMVKESTLF